jgi:hypothetical protein
LESRAVAQAAVRAGGPGAGGHLHVLDRVEPLHEDGQELVRIDEGVVQRLGGD